MAHKKNIHIYRHNHINSHANEYTHTHTHTHNTNTQKQTQKKNHIQIKTQTHTLIQTITHTIIQAQNPNNQHSSTQIQTHKLKYKCSNTQKEHTFRSIQWIKNRHRLAQKKHTKDVCSLITNIFIHIDKNIYALMNTQTYLLTLTPILWHTVEESYILHT